MFDWFFDFLYLLTRSLFRIIDALISGSNMLCGLEPVTINGKKTDLMEWIMSLEQVETGFKVTALVGLFLIVFFSIWGIIRNVVAEKAEGTPAQIAMRAAKVILIFLFIPTCMYVLTKSLNAIAEVLYNGTRGGSDITLGGFLAKSFGQDCMRDGLNVWTATDFDYTDFDIMWKYFNMRHYDYFFSWVAGITILLTMSKVLFIFVERMYSIILLYIISPIPISASIIDEGQKFKAWREQLLAKYCVGYGAILGLNIYTIVVSALCTYDIEYFSNGFVNLVFKLVIIVGGAFSVDKLVGMIGNLVSNGAGDAAMQQAEGMRKGVGSVGSAAAKLGKKAVDYAKKKLGLSDPITKAAEAAASGAGGGGGGAGGGGAGGEGNKNPLMDMAQNMFNDMGNKVKGAFNSLGSMAKGVVNDLGDKMKRMFKRDPQSLADKKNASEAFDSLHKNKGKGAPDGVVVGKGSNGGFTLGLGSKKK